MKQAETIYREMMEKFTELTGAEMDDSADLAVRLYAAAAQLESLYAYADWVLAQGFPQTAVGEYLDYHAELRGLTRRAEGYATGSVTFFVTAARETPLTIAKGTVVATPATVRFKTTAAGTIAAGQTSCTVAVRAVEAGASGNAAAGTVTVMPLAPAGVSSCTNTAAMTGGIGGEEDEALRARVLASFARLPNGANKAFYEEQVRKNGNVAGYQVLPRKRGIGTVDVYVAAKSAAQDSAVAAAVRAELQSVREIAVNVAVTAATRRSVNMVMTLYPADGVSFADAAGAVRTALTEYFDGSLLGKPVYLARLTGVAMGTGMLKNCILTAPQQDVAAQDGVLPILGSLSLSEG